MAKLLILIHGDNNAKFSINGNAPALVHEINNVSNATDASFTIKRTTASNELARFSQVLFNSNNNPYYKISDPNRWPASFNDINDQNGECTIVIPISSGGSSCAWPSGTDVYVVHIVLGGKEQQHASFNDGKTIYMKSNNANGSFKSSPVWQSGISTEFNKNGDTYYVTPIYQDPKRIAYFTSGTYIDEGAYGNYVKYIEEGTESFDAVNIVYNNFGTCAYNGSQNEYRSNHIHYAQCKPYISIKENGVLTDKYVKVTESSSAITITANDTDKYWVRQTCLDDPYFSNSHDELTNEDHAFKHVPFDGSNFILFAIPKPGYCFMNNCFQTYWTYSNNNNRWEIRNVNQNNMNAAIAELNDHGYHAPTEEFYKWPIKWNGIEPEFITTLNYYNNGATTWNGENFNSSHWTQTVNNGTSGFDTSNWSDTTLVANVDDKYLDLDQKLWSKLTIKGTGISYAVWDRDSEYYDRTDFKTPNESGDVIYIKKLARIGGGTNTHDGALRTLIPSYVNKVVIHIKTDDTSNSTYNHTLKFTSGSKSNTFTVQSGSNYWLEMMLKSNQDNTNIEVVWKDGSNAFTGSLDNLSIEVSSVPAQRTLIALTCGQNQHEYKGDEYMITYVKQENEFRYVKPSVIAPPTAKYQMAKEFEVTNTITAYLYPIAGKEFALTDLQFNATNISISNWLPEGTGYSFDITSTSYSRNPLEIYAGEGQNKGGDNSDMGTGGQGKSTIEINSNDSQKGTVQIYGIYTDPKTGRNELAESDSFMRGNNGDTITMKAIPSSGTVFGGWVDKDGNVKYINQQVDVTFDDGELQYEAKFFEQVDVTRIYDTENTI